jgi:ADP-ribosylglycohydrolase
MFQNQQVVSDTKAAIRFEERFAGVLMGTAVGDALGLPMENLSPEKIRRRWPGPLRMCLVFGRGMISDDTEHTLLVAQALLSHSDDSKAFQRALGWKFRWWFAGLPGGVGHATAKACLRLWIGFPSDKCAVISSGSGPAMRSAIIGAFFAHDAEKRREFVLASARLTHRGWQAEIAALAVAEAAALAATTDGIPAMENVLSRLRDLSSEREWQTRLAEIEKGLRAGDSVSQFVSRLGMSSGVSGYSLHVVPVALYAWLRHASDFRAALTAVIECGGDTDTVGAILGALSGASAGVESMPEDWRKGILEWPRSTGFIRELAQRLANRKNLRAPMGPVRYFWPGIIPRNLFFLAVILLHGFRRLLPI